jgi:nucleoid-associated protein YgaU
VAGALAVVVALFLNFRESGDENAQGPVSESSAPETASQAPDASSSGDGASPSEAAAPSGSEGRQASPSASDPGSAGAPTGAVGELTAEAPSASKPIGEPEESAAPKPPSYDIVRVNPKGDAVIAGRAMPGSTVEILEGEKVIGSVKADRRGEWVFVPDQPLTPGDKQFSLSAETPDGSRLESETVVVMSIPEPGPRPGAAGDTGVVVLDSAQSTDEPVKEGAGQVSAAGEAKPSMPADSDAPGDARQPATVVADAAQPAAPAEEKQVAKAAEQPVVVEVARNGGQAARILQGPKEGVRSGDLSLDSINYDDKGNLSIEGKAPEGARVQLYLDNKFVGTAESEKDGKWQVKPSQEVPPGNYTLRVDQVADAGNVRSRLEIPFARAAPIADLPEGSFVIVQPGNSLWRLARRTYGSGFEFVQIYRANSDQIRNPDLIYPGQIFTLPAAN